MGIRKLGWTGMVLAAFALLSAFAGAAFARDGPEETDMPTPTPTDTATVTPSPEPTPTRIPPTATPSPSRTPTPSPTLDPIIEISTRNAVERTMQYREGVEEILRLREYWADPALVLAVIAAESGGDQSALSPAGACGVMQVIPKPWYWLSASSICGSSYGNITMGVWILQHAIENAEGDVRYGLAYYNCSEESVHADRCGSKGGLNYADKVLEHWLPLFEERIGG